MNPSPEAICGAVEEVLESMCFREGEWLGPGTLPPPLAGAGVGFTSPHGECGEFRIAISPDLATGMAADFLAVEGFEISQSEITATILELANVLCGVALGAWKPASDFHLSIPRHLTCAEISAEWPHRFAVEGTPDFAVAISSGHSSSSTESPESKKSSPLPAARDADGSRAHD